MIVHSNLFMFFKFIFVLFCNFFGVFLVNVVIIGTHTSCATFWPSGVFTKYINMCQMLIKALDDSNIVQIVCVPIMTTKPKNTQKI